MSRKDQTDLKRAQDLFSFLTGNVPDDITIKKSGVPKLTDDQAWNVIWYLGNQYWQVPDHIERCGVCGDLYNTHSEGECLDYGKAPYHFCDTCCHGDVANNKRARGPKQAGS